MNKRKVTFRNYLPKSETQKDEGQFYTIMAYCLSLPVITDPCLIKRPQGTQ